VDSRDSQRGVSAKSLAGRPPRSEVTGRKGSRPSQLHLLHLHRTLVRQKHCSWPRQWCLKLLPLAHHGRTLSAKAVPQRQKLSGLTARPARGAMCHRVHSR
jgi:hypothetical protein